MKINVRSMFVGLLVALSVLLSGCGDGDLTSIIQAEVEKTTICEKTIESCK